MKMTLEKAVNAAQTIAVLNRIRMKNTATARKIFSLKKLLEPHLEFYLEEDKKLIEELGGTVRDDGVILFNDQAEGTKKMIAGRKELFATEVDVPIDTPVIFRDAEGIQVSGEEISFLEGLAEFKE